MTNKAAATPRFGRTDRKNLMIGLLFIAPWIVGFLSFTLYPILSSLYYSFTDYNVTNPPVFVGLDNYIHMFTDDANFTKSLGNTGYMLVVGLPLTLAVTFLVSFVLNDKRLYGTNLMRVLFFMPTLVPIVILAILWIWLLQPDTGIINSVLGLFGIQGPGWLASPTWAKPGFILMGIWCAGNMIIIFTAGLQDISPALYEAVEIDGGGMARKFLHITLPAMMPLILYNAITGMIKILQSFTEAFIMTNGGPNSATTFYGLYLYKNAFEYRKMGYASALAWVMLIVTMILTVIMLKATGFGKDRDG